jgi:antitoxin CcdA
MMEKPEDAAVPSQNADARCRWLEENASAFAAQARWHEQHPHPLEDILFDPKPICS